MGRGKTSSTAIEATQTRTQCLELRLQGYSYSEIGEQLRCDPSNVYRHVRVALDILNEEMVENAAELRQVEHLRLEGLFRKALHIIDTTDDHRAMVGAIETARRLSESIRRLYGLDAPQAIITAEDPDLPSRWQGILDDLHARISRVIDVESDQ